MNIITKQPITKSKREWVLITIIALLMVVLWISQRPRLKAYNDCYMSKYEDWSTDCELGGRAH